MKKVKNIISLMLVLTMCFTISPSVFAHEYCESNHVIVEEVSVTGESEITPYYVWNCVDCGTLCNTVCYGEKQVVESGTHKAGILGLGGTCYVDYTKSSSAIMCLQCGDVKDLYAIAHHCEERHSICGTKDVCAMEY